MSSFFSPDGRPHTPAGLADSLANTAVWRAGELGSASQQTVATGFGVLDAVLPGGGWPQGALIEVMQPQAGLVEWGLVAPALAVAQKASPEKMTVLVNSPSLPFGPALGAWQIDMSRLLCVRAGQGEAPTLLWATREALQCADVGAVLESEILLRAAWRTEYFFVTFLNSRVLMRRPLL